MRLSTAFLVAFRQSSAPRILKASGFRRLWIGSVVEAFSLWMERLAIGWMVLDVTGSVFLAALSFAVQSAPNMVIGPLAGALADRIERKRLLAITSASKSAIMVAIGVVVLGGSNAILPVLCSLFSAVQREPSHRPPPRHSSLTSWDRVIWRMPSEFTRLALGRSARWAPWQAEY